MKLLHIASDSSDCIDECLMAVDDDFSPENKTDIRIVLREAEDMGVTDPFIKQVYNLMPEDDHYNSGLATYRPFVG